MSLLRCPLCSRLYTSRPGRSAGGPCGAEAPKWRCSKWRCSGVLVEHKIPEVTRTSLATLVELPNGSRVEVVALDDGGSRLTITQAYPRCTYVCEDLPPVAAAELAEQLRGERG